MSQNAEFVVTSGTYLYRGAEFMNITACSTYSYHGPQFIDFTVNVPYSCHRAEFTNFAAGGRNTYNETKCMNVRVCVT